MFLCAAQPRAANPPTEGTAEEALQRHHQRSLSLAGPQHFPPPLWDA